MMHEGHHHDHECAHEHTHGGHTHTHEHTHEPAAGAGEPVKRAVTMLNYMYSHNSDHTEELAEMAEKLRGLGETAAADEIDGAVAAFREGNAKLHEALHKIGG
ncbi:MAG: cobalt transporter [Lachnospiraceae bacterium]